MTKVVVNGCFDILHKGHIDLLNFAKQQGDHLLVCIDSDRLVAEAKGMSRPVKSQGERKYILENLRSVDEVRVFDTHFDLCDIFRDYRADIMVKGSDYKDRKIVGEDLVGRIIFFDTINGYSTTKTIEDIIDRR